MNRNWQAFLMTRDLNPTPGSGPNEKMNAITRPPSVMQTNDYALLAVTGEDAGTFLQGQTTCDVLALKHGEATPGAICNHKGRVLASFFLIGQDQGYWLLLPKDLAAAIEKKLRMYILRSRVVIENISDVSAIFGLCCETLPDTLEQSGLAPDDIRYPIISVKGGQIIKTGPAQWLAIGLAQYSESLWLQLVSEGFSERSNADWTLLCIANGIPILETKTSEVFVPQMINLDLLGGISFKKGCYTGQEIVARMHYLGKLKRRMYLAATQADRLPEPGEPVYVSGSDQSIGQIVNAAYFRKPEIRLLAVLQIEQVESEPIHLSGPIATPLKILDLPYTFLSA